MYYYGARYYDPRLSIFISVDPLAEKTMEPYSYVGNNPINRIDPTGMEWESASDKDFAIKIQEKIQERITDLKGQNTNIDSQIMKAKEKGKDDKIQKLEALKKDNQLQIDELTKGYNEIQELGDTKEYSFTFQKSSKDTHGVKLLKDGIKPKIALEYNNSNTALHEARHAYQYITEGKKRNTMYFSNNEMVYSNSFQAAKYETSAYKLSYSYQRNYLPIRATSFNSINNDWLKSIPGNPYKIK